MRAFLLLLVACLRLGLLLGSSAPASIWETLQSDTMLQRYLRTLEPYEKLKNDIVFVLDESRSIGADVFPQVINFTELTARCLSVSSDESRLAVITFGSFVRHHINNINDGRQNMCTFLRDLDKINYNSGFTNTGSGLLAAEAILKDGRPNANKVVILLSDGHSNEGPDVLPVSRDLKKSGIIIFCIGVADINSEELRDIATSEDHIYMLENFGLIVALNEYLKSDTVDDSFDWVSNTSLCDSYCPSHHDCCDAHADCYCGAKTGRYECSCVKGFGGISGYKDQCRLCPIGTYKDKIGNKECFLCPPNSTTLNTGSTALQDCMCIVGHVGRPDKGEACRPVACNELKPPEGGLLIPKDCGSSYGANCTFKCYSGYCPFACSRDNIVSVGSNQLTAVPVPRTCLETGQWSGEDFYCDKITCPALNYPMFGKHNCSNTDFGVGIVCEMVCDKGFTLHGSSVRKCLMGGTWTGDETICTAVQCPPLKTNEDLKVKPKECGSKQMPYQSTCVYYCKKGKSLVTYNKTCENGIGVNSCSVNGKWSNLNVKLFCEDIEPPQLKCPSSIKRAADFGEATAVVSWDLPTVNDNVDSNIHAYIIEPKRVKPPHAFPLGVTKVVYEAVDSTGNANTCSFTVTVIDDQPPNVDKCPYHIVIQHTEKSGISVVWEEPEFSDNSGNVNILSFNKRSGDLFRWGPPTTVIYQVSDPSGNIANCTFDVMVKAYSCNYTEPPANGFLACDKWTNGQLCSPLCREGYAFSNSTELVYFCSQRTKKWGHVPGSIPRKKFIFPWADCAEIQAPKGLNVSVQVGYQVTTCSEEDLEQLKEEFIRRLMSKHKRFCPVDKGCNVNNVDISCKKPLKSSRKKRNIDILTEGLLERKSMPFVKPGYQHHVIRHRNKKRQSEKKPLLVISFNVEIENLECETCTSSTIDVENLPMDEKDILDTLSPTITDSVQETYHLKPVQGKFKYDIVPMCKQGSVLENNTCVKCSVGTYFNETTSTCEYCPVNYYQDTEGSMSCKTCPDGTSTQQDKSKRISDCQGPCKPGTFSKTGLEPCLACPKDSYQENWSSTSCLTCPHKLVTVLSGAHSSTQCVFACEAGTYSNSGYSPCLQCPIGTYQPFVQQINCLMCPMGTTTLVVGADSLNYCQTVHFCRDYKPCENNAECISDGSGYECLCLPGFSGKNCEININDCEFDTCENNGTCVDGINSFSCICEPGFNGTTCELNINDCISDPCKNGGTCVDHIGNYSCDCLEGFSGTNCEINIDECASSPCENGGKCFDMQNNYRCCCPEGYNGYNCSHKINMCETDPCENGGTCTPLFNNFTCACAAGYDGQHCEINMDDCTEESCYNGGTCIDGINSTSCICPSMHYGQQCENTYALAPNEFCLEFLQPATYNYVLLSNPHHLSGITLSFYMRSTNSDMKQRGTPVSYSYHNKKKSGAVVDNGLTLYDTNKLILFIHGQAIYTGYVANKDSEWHHYAVAWDSFNGSWTFYVDANAYMSGSGIAAKEYLYPGVFVIGQEQDGLGEGFSILESFVGEITEFNVWNYSLTSQEIRKVSSSCGFWGNVVSWPLSVRHLHGDLSPISSFDLCANIGVCDSEECSCRLNVNSSQTTCEHLVDHCGPNACDNNSPCVQSSTGFACSCQLGYTGRRCEYDIDECLTNNGGCSHGCFNIEGSYFCRCPDNMILESDSHTCLEIEFCHDGDKVYYDGEVWLSSCEECLCSKSVISCTKKACPNITCNYGEQEILLPGDCCTSCQSTTSCSVYPNNTIETFDTMKYMFHGVCKYTLVEDCYDGTFEITFEESNSSDTKKALNLYVMCEKVSIYPDGTVMVNEVNVQLPYQSNFVAIDTVAYYGSNMSSLEHLDTQKLLEENEIADTDSHIARNSYGNDTTDDWNHIELLTAHGVIVQWFKDSTISVSLPEKYRKRTCGLCGNFDGDPKDDMAIRGQATARMLSDPDVCFFTSLEKGKEPSSTPSSAIQRNSLPSIFMCLIYFFICYCF